MAKDVILAADLGGDVLTPDELAAIPDFSGIRKEIWDKFPGAIARKRYRAGEILMREGENGTTAFYILEGTIELYLNSPISHVESHRGGRSGWKKITSYITGAPAAPSNRTPGRTHIPIDASVDLPMEKPLAEVGPGDLGLDAAAVGAQGALVELVGVKSPSSGGGAQIIPGDPAAAAKALVEKLRNEARVL